MPLAWASSIIITPKELWKAIIRRPDAPGAVRPRCTLLYSGTDVRTIRFFIDRSGRRTMVLPADVGAKAARKAERAAQVHDLLLHPPSTVCAAFCCNTSKPPQKVRQLPAALPPSRKPSCRWSTPAAATAQTTGWKSPPRKARRSGQPERGGRKAAQRPVCGAQAPCGQAEPARLYGV